MIYKGPVPGFPALSPEFLLAESGGDGPVIADLLFPDVDVAAAEASASSFASFLSRLTSARYAVFSLGSKS